MEEIVENRMRNPHAAVVHYNGEPFVLFYGHKENAPGSYFSNFYPAPFTVDGIQFRTSEHYLMYHKAVLFGDGERAERILAANTPAGAKAIGREVKGFNQEIWDQSRFDIMIRGLVSKFEAEPFRTALLETGEATLVECSPTDTVRGIGMGIRLESFQRENWKGLNLLGFALMEARRQLRI